MISYLEGELIFKGEKSVVVKAGGVGFRVFVNAEFLSQMPKIGEEVKMHCAMVVRQDALELFGFANVAQLEFFQLLTSVSGVGPKSALAILGVAPLDTLKAAIMQGEPDILIRVSGIGKKTAERIIVDLKGKIAQLPLSTQAQASVGEDADVMEALLSLGYGRAAIHEAMLKLSPETSGTGAKLKELLKMLGQKK